MAHPYLGRLQGQEIRTKRMEQADGARKEDEPNDSSDEGGEDDISREASQHLQEFIAGIHLPCRCFYGVGFLLHLLALSEARGKRGTRLKVSLSRSTRTRIGWNRAIALLGWMLRRTASPTRISTFRMAVAACSARSRSRIPDAATMRPALSRVS